MSKNNIKRRKRSEREILNRQALYEKYIPHISQDFAKIIDSSRNNEFKQRCQYLLKVDDSSKIQEAIAAQLFKLTLGEHHPVIMSKTLSIQESRGQQRVDQTDIRSCFGDLADHIDDEQWPTFDDDSSLPPEKMAEVNVNANCSKIQNTDGTLQLKGGNNEDDPAVRSSTLSDATTCVASDDDNFNSLELHAMLDVSSWEDAATYCLDQQVPCTSKDTRIHPYYQLLIQESGTRGKGRAPPDSDDTHFETLGNLF